MVKNARISLDPIETSGLMDEIEHVYRSLGGIQSEPRVSPGAWDIQFDGWALELDEENHFNRYRLLTHFAHWEFSKQQ